VSQNLHTSPLAHACDSALPEDAERAVVEKHGTRWLGRELKVDAANARAPLKSRVGRAAVAAQPELAALLPVKRPAPTDAVQPLKRARAHPPLLDENRAAPAASRAPRSPAFASIIALGGLVLPCQRGVTGQGIAAFLASLSMSCKTLSPCPPEHLVSLRQDGCTGEVSLLEFADADEAQRVVALLHKRTSIPGSDGICLWARQLGGEGAQVRRWRLIVRNVAFSATEEMLHRQFSSAGFVWDLHIPTGENGAMRGFAFVAYTARAHAELAIATLNGKVVAGRAIAVDWALSKKHYEAHFTHLATAEPAAASEPPAPSAAEEAETDEAAFMSSVLASVVQAAPSEAAPEARLLPSTRLRVVLRRSDEAASAPKVTVFAHNLPPECSVQDIRGALGQFDAALRCRLVVDKLTGRFKGTAFLEFGSIATADAAIERALSDAGVVVCGRRAQLAMAVSKEEARSIGAGKAAGPARDRRNLYLAREGDILDGSAASVGVSQADMAKRRRAAEEKAEKLRNPNFSISKTRLLVRNLPASFGEREMKKLCVDAVREQLGVRPTVQARLLRDSTRLDGDGAPRSRGMAFIDLDEHPHALCVLRFLNNNPMVFGKERRPIVEFAISDARAARQHALNVKRRQQGEGGAAPAAAAAEPRQRVREPWRKKAGK